MYTLYILKYIYIKIIYNICTWYNFFYGACKNIGRHTYTNNPIHLVTTPNSSNSTFVPLRWSNLAIPMALDGVHGWQPRDNAGKMNGWRWPLHPKVMELFALNDGFFPMLFEIPFPIDFHGWTKKNRQEFQTHNFLGGWLVYWSFGLSSLAFIQLEIS